MAERRPIVLQAGRLAELPAGDSLPGIGFDPGALPRATANPPEAFIVRQDGVWSVASYAQMTRWMGGGTQGSGVITELGESIMTENGIDAVWQE